MSTQERTYPISAVDAVARQCHEVNRAFCREMLGDHSHLPWEETPERIRLSAISGVQSLVENPGLTCEELFKSWKAYKLAEGWKHGPVKDMEKREHPNLVENYSDLPPGERAKDALFRATALSGLGYAVG